MDLGENVCLRLPRARKYGVNALTFGMSSREVYARLVMTEEVQVGMKLRLILNAGIASMEGFTVL